MSHKNQEQDVKTEKKAEKPAQPETNAFQKEAAEYKDKYIRAYAEMENVKKRCQQEIAVRTKTAIGDFALDVLAVADNLDRALSTPLPAEMENNAFIVNLMKGLQMTQKAMASALDKNGVKAVDSVGKPFDPNMQKAIQQIEDDSKPENTVVQEWQKGYIIGGDRVLREAMVIVSKKSK